MDNDMRDHVVYLLESSQERKRKIALLHYELEHPVHTTEDEMISAMALGHGDGSGGGFPDGRISDKTFYIALNYQNRAGKLNSDSVGTGSGAAGILYFAAGEAAGSGNPPRLF